MNVLLRASEIVGLPVVTADEGDDVAEVRDLVYDSEEHRLIGFSLNKRGWFRGRMKELLAAEDVLGLGPDAVVIRTAADLADPGESPTALRDRSPSRDVIGATVVTEAGETVGTVRDVVVQARRDAEVVGYEIERPEDRGVPNIFVPVVAQMAVSGDALVLPAVAAEYSREDLSGFGSAVDEYRTRLGGSR